MTSQSCMTLASRPQLVRLCQYFIHWRCLYQYSKEPQFCFLKGERGVVFMVRVSIEKQGEVVLCRQVLVASQPASQTLSSNHLVLHSTIDETFWYYGKVMQFHANTSSSVKRVSPTQECGMRYGGILFRLIPDSIYQYLYYPL